MKKCTKYYKDLLAEGMITAVEASPCATWATAGIWAAELTSWPLITNANMVREPSEMDATWEVRPPHPSSPHTDCKTNRWVAFVWTGRERR